MDGKQKEKFELAIRTNDLVCEIYVIDGQFNRIAKSIGDTANFSLAKGLYSVKVKVGDAVVEKPVTLLEDTRIEFDPIAFNSPVPIPGTNDTTLFQINTASSYSKKDQSDVVLGTGSKLFLFGSIPAGTLSSNLPEEGTDPATGLSLRNIRDKILIDFGRPNIGTYSWEGEPWAACDVELDPGNYILCVKVRDEEEYKQTIVMCHGWQTQIFLQTRNYGIYKKEVKADLLNSSILMSRIEYGFNPEQSVNFYDGTNYRLIEQVSQALKHRKEIVSDELLQILLSAKFDNPMLGIYAAHLILQNKTHSNLPIIQVIVKNLRRLLGLNHPDVEAIALHIGIPTNYSFQSFPMLMNSWAFILEASVTRVDLVPFNSLAYLKSGEFWNSDLWLIWGMKNSDKYTQLKQNIVRIIQKAAKLDEPEDVFKVLSYLINVTEIHENAIGKVLNIIPGYLGIINKIIASFNGEKLVHVTQQSGIPYTKIIALLKTIKLDEVRSIIGNFLKESAYNADPQKGKWGNSPTSNCREIKARVESLKNNAQLFRVTIEVVSTNRDLPLIGEIKFHLHDTFLNPTPTVPIIDDKATLELKRVWGAFTVGAEVDNGLTKLELDLAELAEAPELFKSR